MQKIRASGILNWIFKGKLDDPTMSMRKKWNKLLAVMILPAVLSGPYPGIEAARCAGGIEPAAIDCLSPHLSLDSARWQDVYAQWYVNSLMPTSLDGRFAQMKERILRDYRDKVIELKLLVGDEDTVDHVNDRILADVEAGIEENFSRALSDKSVKFVPPFVILIAGKGGSGKTTAARELVRYIQRHIGKYNPRLMFLRNIPIISERSTDNIMLQDSDRPNPEQGQQEIRIEQKFPYVEHNQSVEALVKQGIVIWQKTYDDVRRGTPKAENQDGNLVIHIGPNDNPAIAPHSEVRVEELGHHEVYISTLIVNELLLDKENNPVQLEEKIVREAIVGKTRLSVRNLYSWEESAGAVLPVYPRQDSKNPAVLGFNDTEYIIDRRGDQRRDQITLVADEPTVKLKSDIMELAAGEERVDFVIQKQGEQTKCLLAYHDKADGLQKPVRACVLRTLNLRVEQSGEWVMLYVNKEPPLFIARSKWEQQCLVVGERKIFVPNRDSKGILTQPLYERIIPGALVREMEGVVATFDPKLNEIAYTYGISAEFLYRLRRIIKREVEKGRPISIDDLAAKRIDLQGKEEPTIVQQGMQNLKVKATSLSLAELIHYHYVRGTLESEEFAQKAGEMLAQVLEIKVKDIQEELVDICAGIVEEMIKNYRLLKNNLALVNQNRAFSIELYTKERKNQGGEVLSFPLVGNEAYFTEHFVGFFENVLKAHGGGIIVPCMLSPKISSVRIPVGLPNKSEIKLNNNPVLVKSAVARSLEQSLRDLFQEYKKTIAAGEQSKAAEILEKAKQELRHWPPLILEMARRGIIDAQPQLRKYAFDLIRDENAKEQLVLYHLFMLTADSSQYDPALVTWDKVVKNKDLLLWSELEEFFTTEIAPQMPDQAALIRDYFDKGNYQRVSDPLGYAILNPQLSGLERLLRDGKRTLLRARYMRERNIYNLDEQESFLLWADVYKEWLREHKCPQQADVVQKLIELVAKDSSVIEEIKNYRLNQVLARMVLPGKEINAADKLEKALRARLGSIEYGWTIDELKSLATLGTELKLFLSNETEKRWIERKSGTETTLLQAADINNTILKPWFAGLKQQGIEPVISRAAWMQAMLQEHNFMLYVMRCDSGIKGLLLCCRNADNSVFIRTMEVSQRGQGYGQQLLAMVERDNMGRQISAKPLKENEFFFNRYGFTKNSEGVFELGAGFALSPFTQQYVRFNVNPAMRLSPSLDIDSAI